MSYNNSQLAHVWAQQQKPRGKTSNGNFSFDGVSLYSYKTEIARFIEGNIVYTCVKYTPTTEGQHKNALRRAITHLESYSVSCRMREIAGYDWRQVAPIIFKTLISDLENSIKEIKNGRTYLDSRLSSIQQNALKVITFYQRYHNIKEINSYSIEHYNHLHTNTLETLKTCYSIDIDKKLAKYKEAEEKAAIKRKEIEAENARLNAEKIERWKNDLSYTTTFYDCGLYLRLNGDIIETSHGAKVPVGDALYLYSLILQEKDISQLRIGEFSVKGIMNDTLIIGCHNIPMSEVHRIANELKLNHCKENTLQTNLKNLTTKEMEVLDDVQIILPE